MSNSTPGKTATNGKATVSVVERPIPTYVWDEPSRYPIVFGSGYRSTYPYTMEDRLRHRRVEKPYQQIILENDLIEVIILPELGGHLWRAYDKVSGKEIFYNNQVVKPGLIGLRGAWCATGVEWNFPIGHSVSTVSPIDFTSMENADGSVSAVVGDLDRTTRMKWTVKVTVFPGKLAFRIDTVLSNPTSYPHRYMYWENAAMHATDGFQFIAPAKRAWTWGGKTDFPVVDGEDKSWYKTHPRSIDYFALGVGQDYFGFYDHERKFGAVHVADYHLMPGKKFFTWGTAEHAKRWEKNLTDEDGPYIELQCGLTPTQAAFDFFRPQTSIRWDELWFPIGDLGYFVHANRLAAVHLSDRLEEKPFPEEVDVALVTNERLDNASVTVSADGRELLSDDGLDFEPGVSKRWKVKLPADIRHLEVKLTCAGRAIVDYSTREWDNIREIPYDNPRGKVDVSRANAKELLRSGIDSLKWFKYADALDMIEKALAKRPQFGDAIYWKGNVLYHLGRYDEAVAILETVPSGNVNYPLALYLIADVARRQGRYDEASAIAGRLRRRKEYAVLALSFAGRLALETKKFAKAAKLLNQAGQDNKADVSVLALASAALRRLGRTAQAESAARQALTVDPLSHIALNELMLLGVDSSRDSIMRGEVESYIELAAVYEDVGLFDDAAQILEHCRAHIGGAGSNPLVNYHLAYCNRKLGRVTEADALLQAASQCCPDRVFPNRREDAVVLEDAIAQNADDALAHYLVGLFLAWKLQSQEAYEHWTKALDGLGDYPVLLRNIAQYLLVRKDDAAGAASYYDRATDAAPSDEELYSEADEAYRRLDSIEDRVASLEKGKAALPDSQKVVKLLSQCYYYAGRYDDAIDTLMSSTLDHWEGDRMAHQTFVSSYIEKGKELLAEKQLEGALECFQMAMTYPENLKVGRPAYPRHAAQLLLSGAALEGLGRIDEARAAWKEGADEVHMGWEGSTCEAGYYKALCQIKIRRSGEARKAFRALTKGVEWHPFHLAWYNDFLKGLGWQGLQEWDKAEEQLRNALEADRTNRKVKYHLELVLARKQAGV